MEALAAVDLGSNSFHMIVARVDHDMVQVLDRLRETVRLASGLDKKGRLDAESKARAVACLERFGQRIRDLGAHQVRAVGTNTLRRATNSADFLRDAEAALGHPIEIIPGREEARLIYVGVCHGIAGAPNRRLVIDIGGGSTECIVGDGFNPVAVHSLYMGCVGYSREFFPDGKISADRFSKAVVAAELELEPVQRQLMHGGWQRAFGASGTMRAVATILQENGWASGTITTAGVRKLRKALTSVGNIQDLTLPGLDDDRRPVIAGGAAIVSAIVEFLGVEELWISPTALREGLLYDMLGRLQHEDPRDRTIEMLTKRYTIDEVQADRVMQTAMAMLAQVDSEWDLGDDAARSYLSWACTLHEIGLAVSYTGHHKHGGYLIEQSDLPGFTTDEQRFVASLVRGQRRKLHPTNFDLLRGKQRKRALRLCVLLRLATLLNRNRTAEVVPVPELQPDGATLQVTFDADWLSAHPLVHADFERDQKLLKAVGFTLTEKQRLSPGPAVA